MFKRTLICGAAAFLIATPFGVDLSRLSLQPVTAEAAVNVSFEVFFNDLQPHGSWVHTADYPYVFVPADVGPDWAPYTHGHWIYTERYGWYFESDEPIAAITYHYGRWAYSTEIGWYWVPGTRWAPAWVVWRRGEGHLGWAPMPPERKGYAIDVSVTVTEVPESYWVFVPVQEFLAPQLTVVIQRGDRARDVFTRTQVAGPVVVQNNIIVNNVIDINFIQQQTKQKVVVRKVQEVNDPQQAAQAQGGDTAVKAFVANVEAPKKDAKPKQVVDAKEAKAKQAQGGGATANAGAGAAPAGTENCKADASGKLPANCPPAAGQASGQPAEGKAGAAAANADVNKPAEGAKPDAAASADNCKADASGAMPANCPPAEGKAKAGAAANAEADKPAEGAKAGAAANAEANKPAEGDNAGAAASAEANKPTKGAKAGAAASADNCKPDASGNTPANCPAAEGKAKAGAAAEANKPAGNEPAAAEAKPAGKKPGEAAKAAPTDNGGAAAATETDNGAATGKKKPAAGQAAEKGKGNKGCAAGEAGCEANANGAGAVSQEKTSSIGKGAGAADNGNGGAEPQVQSGQPGGAKCSGDEEGRQVLA